MTDLIESEVERILRERIDELETRLARLEDATGLFASDKDLEGRGAAAKVKFDPRGWRGRSFKGSFMRDCDADFLDAYANTLSYLAENPKPGKEQYAKYDRLDSARARSWARRLRNGGMTQAIERVAEQSTTFATPSFASTDFGASSFDDVEDPFSDSDEGPL